MYPKAFKNKKKPTYKTKKIAEVDINTKQIVKVYPSLVAAAKAKGLKSTTSLSQMANHTYLKNHSAAGCLWEFV